MSETSTTAPRRLAVARACSPATPPPMMTTAAGRNRAGGGHQEREVAVESRCRHQNRLVAGDGGLRRQRVHRLRPGDAWHQFHRHRGDAAARQLSRTRGRSVVRVEQADPDAARGERLECFCARRRRAKDRWQGPGWPTLRSNWRRPRRTRCRIERREMPRRRAQARPPCRLRSSDEWFRA